MFKIDEYKNIHCTRGDAGTIQIKSKLIPFKKGDKLKINIIENLNYKNIVSSVETTVEEEETNIVNLYLPSDKTRLGDVINFTKNYEYEIQLNGNTQNAQTIVGFDEDGRKYFILYPEGEDYGNK